MPGLGAKETLNYKRQTSVELQSLRVFPKTYLISYFVTSPRLLRYVNIDFGIPSAGLAALIGFLGMEIQIPHGYGSIQNALLGRFP